MKLWRKPFDYTEKTTTQTHVYIDKERCKGCGFCVDFCPREVLKMSSELNPKGYYPAVVDDESILDMVRHHHERYDGKGYPDGLHGKQITQGAKVIAVADAYCKTIEQQSQSKELSLSASIITAADAYDAMTSNRSYRNALSKKEALEEISKGAASQFDPEVVNAFLRINKFHH